MGCQGSKEDRGQRYALGQDEERVTAVRGSRNPIKTPSSTTTASRTSPVAAGALTILKGSTDNADDKRINNYKPKKPKLDPKDFRFIGLKAGVHVKPPESINGQAFTIDDCEDCDLYILDHCAQVNIDGCRNCRIFVGPTAGSIFLRTSTNVKCAFVARQVRLRDVSDSQLSLLCRTRPILETSMHIGITCFSLDYPALAGQLKAAKLEVVHNFWWWPYDFTPHPPGDNNWIVLPPETDTRTLLGELPSEVTSALGGDANDEGVLVVTWGDRPQPSEKAYLFVIFPGSKQDAAMQFINQAKHQSTILFTNSVVVDESLWNQMSSKAGWARDVERALAIPGPGVGVELCCDPVVHKTLTATAHMLGGSHTPSDEVGSMFRKLGLDG